MNRRDVASSCQLCVSSVGCLRELAFTFASSCVCLLPCRSTAVGVLVRNGRPSDGAIAPACLSPGATQPGTHNVAFLCNSPITLVLVRQIMYLSLMFLDIQTFHSLRHSCLRTHPK